MPRIFKDHSKIDLASLDGRRKFFGAVTAFLQAPQRVAQQLVSAGVREFTSASDFPTAVRDAIEKYHVGIEEIDVAYERIFAVKDFRSTRKDGFKIRDVSSGLTFAKTLPGQPAKVFKVSGSEVSVGFDLYGGGLEYLKTWFDDQDWWAIEDQTAEFRAKWYMDKATIIYALIDAVSSSQNMAWQGSGTDARIRDIATINAACVQILKDLKAKGMAVTPMTRFALLAPIDLKARIDAALTYSAGITLAGTRVQFGVEPVYTLGLSATDKYYVALPGRKAQIGERMDLTVLSEENIVQYATTVVGWGRYGGAIGEADQFQRCSVA